MKLKLNVSETRRKNKKIRWQERKNRYREKQSSRIRNKKDHNIKQKNFSPAGISEEKCE